MSGVAVNCINDIEAKLSTIQALKGKVFSVYSEEELTEKTKGVVFPAVGVVYDGMRASPEPGATLKMGLSAELVISVMVFFKQNTKATKDPKDTMIDLMDTIRNSIKSTKSPSGHYWKFQLEAAVEGKQGVLAFIQRWATPVQLT